MARAVNIFPNEDSCTRLVTILLIEYSEDRFVPRGGCVSNSLIQSIRE